jgi:hypothetical protein
MFIFPISLFNVKTGQTIVEKPNAFLDFSAIGEVLTEPRVETVEFLGKKVRRVFVSIKCVGIKYPGSKPQDVRDRNHVVEHYMTEGCEEVGNQYYRLLPK